MRRILATGSVADDVAVTELVHAGPDSEQPIEVAADRTVTLADGTEVARFRVA